MLLCDLFAFVLDCVDCLLVYVCLYSLTYRFVLCIIVLFVLLFLLVVVWWLIWLYVCFDCLLALWMFVWCLRFSAFVALLVWVLFRLLFCLLCCVLFVFGLTCASWIGNKFIDYLFDYWVCMLVLEVWFWLRFGWFVACYLIVLFELCDFCLNSFNWFWFWFLLVVLEYFWRLLFWFGLSWVVGCLFCCCFG